MEKYSSANATTNPSGSRSDSGIEGSLGSGSTSLTINHAALDTLSTVDASDLKEDATFDNTVTDDCHSPTSLDDDWCRVDSGISTETITGAVRKINENDSIDERDRFSPVDFPADLPVTANDDNVEDNNRSFHHSAADRSRLSSKEEKQRQNEEIVILESSSVSSETGSWESVFPQRHQFEVKDACKSFLSQEQKFCTQSTSHAPEETASFVPVAKKSSESETPSPGVQYKQFDDTSTLAKANHSLGACFIDASTLLDDEDVYPTSYTPQPILPAVPCRGPRPLSPHLEKSKDSPVEDLDKDIWPIPSQLDRLQSFHKDFGRCETLKSQPHSALDLTSHYDHQSDGDVAAVPADRIINLSDEQKLNKRDKEQIVMYDIKDQFSSDSPSHDGPSIGSSGVAGVADKCRSDECMRSSGGTGTGPMNTQKEQERKQGTMLFQNSIQQYSTHVMTPHTYVEENNYSDLSLPSVYSGSSEHGNDCTSAFETSSQYSSNCGDATDGGTSNNGPPASSVRYSKSIVSEPETVIYPDTPHNSIIHIDNGRQVRRDDSGIYTPESQSDHHNQPIRNSRIDAAPIVSGGVSAQDFALKPQGSPMTQRRTETCPIVSGGSIPDDFDVTAGPKSKYVEKPQLSAAVNSWVVDMSDCNNRNRRRRSDSSSSSIDTTSRSFDTSVERSESASSHKSLGFYVSLKDMKPPRLSDEVLSKSLNYRPATANFIERKRSTGFYIDLSGSDGSQTATPPPSKNTQTPPANTATKNDKKNMFSMFIDFGDEKISQKRQQPEDFSTSLPISVHRPKYGSSSLDSTTSGHGEKYAEDGHYMSIESEPPVALRRTQKVTVAQTTSISTANRHSWSTTKEESPQSLPYKRSVSVSSADNGIMNILDKIPLISKASNLSIDTPTSNVDDSSSSCSNSLKSGVNLPDVMNQSASRRRQCDAKINETFDKSSQGSLTDGILSKDSSPTTDTDDITFQNEDELTKTVPSNKVAVPNASGQPTKVDKPPHTMESLQATIEKQRQLLDTVTEEAPISTFVKLSDMDKPVQHIELQSQSMGSNRIGKLFDGSRIGSRNSWHNMSRSTGEYPKI